MIKFYNKIRKIYQFHILKSMKKIFLRNIDEEMDCQGYLDNNYSIEESLEEVSDTHYEVIDEISDLLDTIIDPSEEQSDMLSNSAEKQARRITEKMEKICVAPGESGKFQNWKKDVFLEEKCFPENSLMGQVP